ncbi:hypothetical protein SAMN02745751_03412 [Dethiosulfatibacter aminovorans DSM 17477]|uniref:Uncharacterized protein n=1 Tax=Dethiosulfatibacter aminovorans DSM 17477 TaxID=1121476 RepID=A0A1M6M9Z8_9FIRM|nr:hypothetical protein [Dethiosulfatibacter aminovorans]SHJ80229.1 hypothetical protein SAMN02745751_03412 [Dethiosulfatibacter aminovorans DSM 17477]
MNELEIQKINGYIDLENIKVPNWKVLLSSYFFFMIISIPTALYGSMNELTNQMIGSWVIILGIWTLYFIFNKHDENSYVLYMGMISVFTSITALIATFEMLNLLIDVNYSLIIIVVLIYLGLLGVNIWNIIRLVKKGYFLDPQKSSRTNYGLILGTSVLGIGVARAFFGGVGNDKAIMIIVSVLVFFVLVFLSGTHNFLKYYYIRITNVN